MKNKPSMIVRLIKSLRVILENWSFVLRNTQMAATSPTINPHNNIENPPMDSVSVTGGWDISTAASPPMAANPIIPALKIPA